MEKENSQSKSGRKQKRKKIPDQKNWKKAKRKNSQSKIERKQKERKFPIQDQKKTEEICRKVLDQTISEQYKIVTN